ncbi:MFS-1 protein [Gloeophyllum trabeum ATCC 11539]|uniref:MFS-1 protein n=1 Tax=Gloeophyllum trabeum (strain ATCC 11539 / FP-39264 / Madison 617) TaxID=670483 RepID=S7PXE0_GLOTA|nr:MFS-1 protein [Gloeophyllum trabeum ATCC 11539]EPQ52178.1 MFS-1 protein [Gloeophyllum trabeum ATCC 11539]
MAPTRVFGSEDSALVVEDDVSSQNAQTLPRGLGRFSFSKTLRHRPSILSRLSLRNSGSGVRDEETGEDVVTDKPLIPSALQQPGEADSTPLPVLSMIVLSITMLGEFLSANVSAPFLLFMVKGFGQFTDDADAGFWTGILASTFFLTQFLTSLLWATVADRHGQRAVLFVSLLGTACTCCLFGTSTNLQEAICIRLLQGIFAGAIGVARGCVTFVTDPSNEGRAYAILGFCWGFGGVAGAIIGGSFENPAKKWPGVFNDIPIFVHYPYLLPCAVASCITFTGAILSLFLGYDGGPREGAIRLPPEKDAEQNEAIPEVDEEGAMTPPVFGEEEPEPRTMVGSITRNVGRKLSGYFAKRVHDAHASETPPLRREESVPLLSESQQRTTKPRQLSRASRVDGSAYGYGTGYRHRLANSMSMGARRESTASAVRRRLYSTVDPTRASVADSELNFAQRILLANENAVTNIADLWVAAAMNVDNEEVFESDDEGSDVGDTETAHGAEATETGARPETSTSTPSTPSRRGRRQSRSGSNVGGPRPSANRRVSGAGIRPHLSPRRSSDSRSRYFTPTRQTLGALSGQLEDMPSPGGRRYSNVPTIFSHTGVRTPSAVLDAQSLLSPQEEAGAADGLAPIMESRRASVAHVEAQVEPQQSLFWQLPLIIIVQYGLLALHSTTHDQVFYLYLVTDYEGGGLNLNATHFSQLIALMCLAQIAYQFYLYPPPRGRFSHLAMFRIGSLLYIPAYLSVILYRVPFASATDDGNFVLMAGNCFPSALRFCGITFSYTAVAILLNYMSPPHVVGLANGIAQSIVSLARFIGPILGGVLWSTSVAKDPSGYPLGFFVCAGICALAVAHTFFIR